MERRFRIDQITDTPTDPFLPAPCPPHDPSPSLMRELLEDQPCKLPFPTAISHYKRNAHMLLEGSLQVGLRTDAGVSPLGEADRAKLETAVREGRESLELLERERGDIDAYIALLQRLKAQLLPLVHGVVRPLCAAICNELTDLAVSETRGIATSLQDVDGAPAVVPQLFCDDEAFLTGRTPALPAFVSLALAPAAPGGDVDLPSPSPALAAPTPALPPVVVLRKDIPRGVPPTVVLRGGQEYIPPALSTRPPPPPPPPRGWRHPLPSDLSAQGDSHHVQGDSHHVHGDSHYAHGDSHHKRPRGASPPDIHHSINVPTTTVAPTPAAAPTPEVATAAAAPKPVSWIDLTLGLTHLPLLPGRPPARLPLTCARLRKLARQFMLHQPQGTPGQFLQATWCMLRRYQSLFGAGANEGIGLHAALPEAAFGYLRDQFGVQTELFASPLNAFFDRYCSLFPDTDAPFGSLGSMMRYCPEEGSFEANPPFAEEVMVGMVEQIESLLRKSTEGHRAPTPVPVAPAPTASGEPATTAGVGATAAPEVGATAAAGVGATAAPGVGATVAGVEATSAEMITEVPATSIPAPTTTEQPAPDTDSTAPAPATTAPATTIEQPLPEQRPLSFIVVLPSWSDTPSVPLLQKSPFLRASITIDRGERPQFIVGDQHRVAEGSRYFAAVHGLFVYILQNEAGYLKWTPSPQSAQSLRCGFPPKLIHCEDFAPLNSIFKNNDVIVVSGTASAAASRPTAAAKPVAAEPGVGVGGDAAGHRLSGAPVTASDFHSLFLPNRPQARPPPRDIMPSRPGADRFAGYSIVRRAVKGDNNCCFNSIGYLMEHSVAKSAELRQTIADVVRYNPQIYSMGTLGRSNADYQRWIMEPQHWGGGIELAIFADIYQVEIASIDMQTGRMDLYGQDRHYPSRCHVVYTGSHYDPLVLSPSGTTDASLDVTVFDVAIDQPTTDRMVRYVRESAMQQARAAMGTAGGALSPASDRLRCGTCGRIFEDQMGAAMHASESGHSNFAPA
ncbi:putative ubiquitin thioesterase OTU1 [Paratrimastix pyriformis]|uniref:Ubiquitin thioesterase OTU1 n=1 Tax=Paratrimastix pyriformis TaxID=342808 RepID=A0ABQ8UAQ2_9EUKA|nr:putative ubiquitin thioesterase OTU1 [Paratrimastix pyriformis]